jgi:alpha-galactosidase
VADPNKIGPEYTFGIYMSKMLNEPILIIKTAWGGKSLYNDYRPPSAGENSLVLPKVISEDFKNSTGFNYKLMMDYVKEILADPKAVYPAYDAKEGYELAGFVWFQGFNDKVGPYPEAKVEVQEKAKGKKKQKAPKDFSEYSRLLGCFIRDIRKELAAPKLPFVIGILGVNGKSDDDHPFRAAMAAPAETDEFKGNVVNVFSGNYWPTELDPVDKKVSEIKRDAKRKIIKEKKDNPGKEETLSKEERKVARDEAKAEGQAKIKAALTKEEMHLLETEMSNAGYHYYGSAKFFAQLGKAFAEALVKTSK